MTLPTAPQIGSTGVIRQPGIAEELAPFLQLLMQKEELALRKERVKLEKQELESRLSQQAMEAQQQQALGGALLQALLGGETQTATIPQMPGLAVPPEGLPVQTLTPIGQAAQQLPLAAVPAFVEQTRDIRAEGRRARAVEGAIRATVKPEQQAMAQGLATYQLHGVQLPVAVQQTLYPGLFPTGVDPEVMGVALRYGVAGAGAIKWGQIRNVFNIPPNAIPDDFTFADTAGAGRMNELQAKAGMYYQQMHFSNQQLEDLATGRREGVEGVAEPVSISIPAQFQRELRVRAAGSGPFALGYAVADMFINLGLSSEQQQIVSAQLRGGNAFRYQMSGQQTSDREFVSILSYYVESVGDSPEVQAQKRAFRQVVENATKAVWLGTSRQQAMDQVLLSAQGLGVPDEVMATLQQMREYAKVEDRNPSMPVLSRDSGNPNDPATLEQVRDIIEKAEKRRFIMGERP